MNWLKRYLTDFPTHPATVAVSLLLILLLGLVLIVRIAMGLVMPDGYDQWLWVLVSLTGVAGAVGIGRRLTDMDYAAVKAGAVQPTQVNVASPSSVTVTETAKPAPQVLTKADADRVAQAMNRPGEQGI
jgi:hypothetical protein